MIYFGIAGWSYPDWEGIVYPAHKERRFDPLAYLANYFDTIELNNTFYRIPESKMVESWAKRVQHNGNFRFTAKIWQGFTHGKENPGEAELRQFLKAMEPLRTADRLGTLMAQFPVSFRNEPQNRERLSWIVEKFHGFPMTVEFRHRSWVVQEVLDWMSERQIGFCNVDEPVFRRMLKPTAIITGPVAYVRFHGRNYKTWFAEDGNRDSRYDYLYTDAELEEWVPRVQEMASKSGGVYVVGNNHFRGQAPANILQLKAKTVKGPVDVPDSLFEAYPQLKAVARRKKPAGRQQELF
ncbi:MAG TPA: DUF72 domain-containing protein [Acidobacteriota bacterium]|nr:DUF72 domain-containing protein [Acidobacteriota bacterium]